MYPNDVEIGDAMGTHWLVDQKRWFPRNKNNPYLYIYICISTHIYICMLHIFTYAYIYITNGMPDRPLLFS